MEMCIYRLWDNNLCSIKSNQFAAGNYSFIYSLFEKILPLTSKVVVTARIQDNLALTVPDIAINKMKEIEGQVEDLYVGENFIELAFSYKVISENNALIRTCLSIWHNYEQPSFTFLVNEEDYNINKETYFNLMLGWSSITEVGKSFVVFKGIEEDVLWIAKHKELSFDKIVDDLEFVYV